MTPDLAELRRLVTHAVRCGGTDDENDALDLLLSRLDALERVREAAKEYRAAHTAIGIDTSKAVYDRAVASVATLDAALAAAQEPA